jgi:hypothetical protein
MKWWTVSILLLVMVGLSVPFVTADEKGAINPIDGKEKIRTPANVEMRSDPFIGLKKILDPNAKSNVDVIVDGKTLATIPDNSPLMDIPVTEDCLQEHPYGTLNWFNCEVGR